MMTDMVNCDICYPKQAKESVSPVRKKKEAKSPNRNTTCNFTAQYDVGKDTRRRHRRQYEVKQVTCQKCRPIASSSEDMNAAKARFWRRARKPETEDKGIGYSWSKRSFANMRHFLYRPCKWCKDYKDTSSQCGSAKKDEAKIPNKPFTSIQTRTLTVMTDKKMTRDKSALMNLPTIKEDCGVQTRSKGITKPIKLKNYAIHESAVGPSSVGDNILQKQRTKKSLRHKKMPAHDAAVEQTTIGDTAVVDIYNKDNQSSEDSDEKKLRRRDAKIANKRCGIWNIQFLTHAKHYPAIRLEISPRQTVNRLAEALPKISRETAKENIISWFDYKTHSKATLRSKKHVTTEKRTTTTQLRGMRNYIVNRCTISDTNTSVYKSDDSEISNSIVTEDNQSEANLTEYNHNIKNQHTDRDKNLYRDGNIQGKVEVYQLFTNLKESASTINKLFDTPSISSVNAEEIDLDNQTLYDSLVLQTTDKEDEFDNNNWEFRDENRARHLLDTGSIATLGSNTYIIISTSGSSSEGNMLQSGDLKMAVYDLYTESEIGDITDDVYRLPKCSSEKGLFNKMKNKINF